MGRQIKFKEENILLSSRERQVTTSFRLWKVCNKSLLGKAMFTGSKEMGSANALMIIRMTWWET